MDHQTADRITIGDGRLSASIKLHGAELCSVKDASGREMLWQAGPAWPRHAPVLFPIVGRLAHHRLRHNGQDHSLTQHGFARDRLFTATSQDAHSCTLTLQDDDATRALYPFAFRFSLSFSVADGLLTIAYRCDNTGRETLPVNMGAHPAFIWPLADGIAKSAHVLTFEQEEDAPIPRLRDGLLGPAIHPSPIVNRVLQLDEQLFATDAIILPEINSRSVRFTAPGAPGIEMTWQGFPAFGIWMRPPGDFLCLEPWHGMASPQGFEGEITDKPGVALLPPGQTLAARFTIRILETSA